MVSEHEHNIARLNQKAPSTPLQGCGAFILFCWPVF